MQLPASSQDRSQQRAGRHESLCHSCRIDARSEWRQGVGSVLDSKPHCCTGFHFKFGCPALNCIPFHIPAENQQVLTAYDLVGTVMAVPRHTTGLVPG